jgi:hypothetical protein
MKTNHITKKISITVHLTPGNIDEMELKDKNLIDFKMDGVVCLKRFKDGSDSCRDGNKELERMRSPQMLREFI